MDLMKNEDELRIALPDPARRKSCHPAVFYVCGECHWPEWIGQMTVGRVGRQLRSGRLMTDGPEATAELYEIIKESPDCCDRCGIAHGYVSWFTSPEPGTYQREYGVPRSPRGGDPPPDQWRPLHEAPA